MKSKPYLSFCLIISLLISTELWGQNISIGISSGATFFTQKAEMEDEYYGKPLYKTRFITQGDLMVHINENFGFKLGIAYEQKGYDRKEATYYGYGINEHKFDYLSFPLVAEISFGHKIKVKAYAGASIEYLLKHIWVWEIKQNDRRPINKTDEYGRVYYSALVGIGAEFPLSKKVSIELGGRCSIGLKTLQKENSWVKFKHFGFATLVGLRYNWGN